MENRNHAPPLCYAVITLFIGCNSLPLNYCNWLAVFPHNEVTLDTTPEYVTEAQRVRTSTPTSRVYSTRPWPSSSMISLVKSPICLCLLGERLWLCAVWAIQQVERAGFVPREGISLWATPCPSALFGLTSGPLACWSFVR